MSHAYNQAVQLLEDARLGADAASKASALQSLRELVVHAHPQELMPALLPEILELRLQPESALRRVLPDVIDGVLQVLPTLDSLLQCLMCLTGLLADPVAAVVRRAAQSAHPLFRAALVRVALTPLDAEPALQAQVWEAARAMPAGLAAGARSASTDAARVSCLRGLESAALLLSAERLPAVPGLSPAPAALPASHAVLTRAGLAQEADAAAREVAAVVRTCDAAPGPMAEAALRAAGALATQRPHFMPRLVPALLSVAARQATMVGETATTSGDGGTAATTESGTPTARDDGKSVTLPPATRKALTAALAQVRRCTHPLAAAWARKVDRALADLAGGGGTQDGAGEACVVAGGRDGAAASKPSQSAPGRPAEDPRPPPAKRPCTEDRATEPAGPALPVESPRADGAELATRVDELVARGDSAGLAALYASLDAESAAELVLARLHPPGGAPASLAADGAPLPAWQEDLLRRMAAPGNASAVVPPPVTDASRQPARSAAPSPSPLVAGATAATPTPPLPAGTAGLVARFTTDPLPLSAGEAARLRALTMRRLAAAAGGFGHWLAPRLAATQADLAGPFLEELGTDFHARGGVEAVLDFLHAAFAAEGRQDLGGEDEAVTERQQGDGYRAVLSKALDLVRRALPPTDRSLISVLLSAPALPAELLRDTLEGLMQTDLDHATLGLLAARDLILARPPAREVALAAVLAAAHSEDAGVRDRAVRLLTNRLWGCLGGRLQPKILREAERSLRQLVVREDGAAVKQEADGTAAARVQQEADGAAAARVKAEATDGAATTSEDAGVEARADTEATAVKRELGEGAAPSVEGTGSVVDPAAACALFCALCTRQPGLLPRLFEAFGSASASGREGILKYAGGLATTLGPTSRDLLGALADLPENCMDLALGMLHALASALPALPEGLVRAAADLAQASCDARPLVPLLRGLGREGLLARLPLLLGLPGAEAGAALRGAAADRLVPPSELLVALHGLDPVAVPGGVRAVMAALGDCLADPDAFPAEAVAGAISALLTRVPLPPLLLRTALQAQASGPGLAAFVARTVLPALAEGRVWEDPGAWRGWVLAAGRGAPATFPALLALPAAQLRAARADLPPAVAEGLAAHALRETHALPRETVALFREG